MTTKWNVQHKLIKKKCTKRGLTLSMFHCNHYQDQRFKTKDKDAHFKESSTINIYIIYVSLMLGVDNLTQFAYCFGKK